MKITSQEETRGFKVIEIKPKASALQKNFPSGYFSKIEQIEVELYRSGTSTRIIAKSNKLTFLVEQIRNVSSMRITGIINGKVKTNDFELPGTESSKIPNINLDVTAGEVYYLEVTPEHEKTAIELTLSVAWHR